MSVECNQNWSTEKEISYLNSIGTHTNHSGRQVPRGSRLKCLRGYVVALRTYKRRWDVGVDPVAVKTHAVKLLTAAVKNG